MTMPVRRKWLLIMFTAVTVVGGTVHWLVRDLADDSALALGQAAQDIVDLTSLGQPTGVSTTILVEGEAIADVTSELTARRRPHDGVLERYLTARTRDTNSLAVLRQYPWWIGASECSNSFTTLSLRPVVDSDVSGDEVVLLVTNGSYVEPFSIRLGEGDCLMRR